MAMFNLKTIDPVKALKGRLNHLKVTEQSLLTMTRLANSIGSLPQQKSSIDKYSLSQIQSLSSTTNLSTQSLNKLTFDLYAHKIAARRTKPGTIHEHLDQHQKNIVSALLKYTDQLNSRQMLYLQYIIRKKMQSIYPNWDNLHFNPDSPFLRQFLVMPTLKSIQNLYEIKTIQKKKVISTIAEVKKQSEANIAV